MGYKHKFYLIERNNGDKTTELSTCVDMMTADFLADYYIDLYDKPSNGFEVVYKHGKTQKTIVNLKADSFKSRAERPNLTAEEKAVTKQVMKVEQRYIAEERRFYHVSSSFDVGNYVSELIGNRASEVLLVMCLSTKNDLIAYSEVFKGSLNQSVAHPREIFQLAILNNSARILIAHNHPSGNVNPSRNDMDFTARVRKAGEILGIEVLDHMIVNNEGEYFSFREENMFV